MKNKLNDEIDVENIEKKEEFCNERINGAD